MTEYLFPFFQDEVEEVVENNIEENEIYKDIAWDYKYNIPIIYDGDFLIVEGLEAVKSWAYRALQTQRAKYLAFSWNYGVDTESFIGKVLTTKEKIDITQEILDCLLQNKHITSVTGFKFVAEKRTVAVRFKINTEYGDLIADVAENKNVTSVENEFVSLPGVRVHIGATSTDDTPFWYDPSDTKGVTRK